MSSSFTFGVEMEFALAYLNEGETPLAPVDPQESRKVFFPATSEEVDPERERLSELHPTIQSLINYQINGYKFRLALKSVRRIITSIFISNGFPADPLMSGFADPTLWVVKDDGSVKGPENSPYRWLPMEITSPALPFTSASLKAILDVCSLLTQTFITETNLSTGLHVHISAGTTPIKFGTMKNLLIFLWSFESQINTLHPPPRQGNQYCKSLRSRWTMIYNFFDKWGAMPSLLQGIVEIAKCQNFEEMLELAECAYGSKMMTCNILNALRFVEDPNSVGIKPTVEFRQHEGTLDGERIVNWVKLLVGIVQRLEEIHPESLLDLFSQVQHETWEKTDKAADNSANQSKFGPIPAESSFTIIDLLEWLGLDEAANYYRDRLFLVNGEPKQILPQPFIFEANKADVIPNRSPAHCEAEQESLQRIWQSMMLVGASTREVNGAQVDLDHHDPLWPKNHREDLEPNALSLDEGAGESDDENSQS